ncbi:hypothetical protein R2360_12980 [Mycobacteroides chelonae]|nr:hypothetical protein [Mycobacteroides chelonae]MEC4843459.1 hypothetical protein [Mycobacteroides chelonae]
MPGIRGGGIQGVLSVLGSARGHRPDEVAVELVSDLDDLSGAAVARLAGYRHPVSDQCVHRCTHS